MRIADQIALHATERSRHDAVVEAGLRMTWEEFNRDVRARARALAEAGVRRGDRVAAELPNGREFLSTMAATWLLGAIFVPLNLRWTESERAAAVRDAGAELVVRPGRIRPEPGPIALPIVAGSEVAAIFYTSGSSGEPKGVVHTHDAIEANAHQFVEALDLTPSDVNYGAAPFFHVAGLGVFTIPLLVLGGTTICARTFEPARALAEMDAYRATCACMVPQMWNRIRNHINFDDADLSLRIAVSGGAPTSTELLRHYGERGVKMIRGYGMTEAGPMATIQRPDRPNHSPYDCGQPGAEVDVRIVDEERRPVPAGEAGEIAIRGPNLMSRYWKRPAETAAVIDSDGWYYTRDRGALDGSRLEVLGRIDDMIISGGENVFPSEVEEILSDVPAIKEVAVIGLPDERWGEVVAAVVVPAAGESVTQSTVVSALIGRIARYKIPRELHLVDTLPVASTGKVDRGALRRRFGAGPSRRNTPT